MANATPTTPKDQFSSRLEQGMGVAHRKNPGGGRIALFGNTPLETQNFRKFVTQHLDFLAEWEVNTTNVWTLSALGGAAGHTFSIVTDVYDGQAYLDTGTVTNDEGCQVQYTAGNSAGEFFNPFYPPLVCVEFFAGAVSYTHLTLPTTPYV